MPAKSSTKTKPIFLDRELSWLDFNHRVLALAEDPNTPLLERVKFVAIHAANLDEFFQVRVSSLIESVTAGLGGGNGQATRRTTLKQVRATAADQLRRAAALFNDELRPALGTEGIMITPAQDVTGTAAGFIERQFHEAVYPVLTPMAVDPARPFPYISDLSLNLAVSVERGEGAASFARVKVPQILPRFIELPEQGQFVPLESIIAANLGALFPGVDVLSHAMFRVTRDADIEIDDTEADDVLQLLKEELSQRRFGAAVRLEVSDDLDEAALRTLTRELNLDADGVVSISGLLNAADLVELSGLDRPELKYRRHKPLVPSALLNDRNTTAESPAEMFAMLAKSDALVHLPYESFTDSVERFIRLAADDPDVLAIKMTMYRTSERTRLVESLIRAAKSGKQVVVVVELKARFDEHANIEWADQLERAGVHVSYGLLGLKTHCKVALVVRREGPRGAQIERYAHIGTGNYNADTARYYEDFGLLTSDEAITADIADLFNTLTGYSRQQEYRSLVVAPHSFGSTLRELIEREMEAPNGQIFWKINSLVDRDFISLLYAASGAGVDIELIVRGICCLVPGVEGLSENIVVRSIVGQFLEHSRLFRFGDGVDRPFTYLLGSGDVMPRNLQRRVEAVVPVTDEDLTARLTSVVNAYRSPKIARWELGPSGRWEYTDGKPLHPLLINRYVRAARKTARERM